MDTLEDGVWGGSGGVGPPGRCAFTIAIDVLDIGLVGWDYALHC